MPALYWYTTTLQQKIFDSGVGVLDSKKEKEISWPIWSVEQLFRLIWCDSLREKSSIL